MKRTTLILILLALAACGGRGVVWNMPFDKGRWMEKDGHYGLREGMVKDLIKNYLREGMTYQEVVELIGGGNRKPGENSLTAKYEIAVDYVFHDIDPVGGVDLEVEFTADSLVRDFSLTYWGKRDKTNKNPESRRHDLDDRLQ